MPGLEEFEYTFDRMAQIIETFTEQLGLESYTIYLMDYGAPIGFRLATKYPERVETLIIQNGNAYVEGIDNDFWEPIRAYWKNRDAVDEGLDNELLEECEGRLQENHDVQRRSSPLSRQGG